MSKKSLIIIAVLILLIVITVVLYFVLTKCEDNLDYTELIYRPIETTIKVGIPKEKGFETRKVGSQGNIVEYYNEEGGYRISAALYERTYEVYENHKNSVQNEEGFKEIKINKFDGYEYNSTTSSRVIVLSLGESSNGFHRVYEIDITRTKNYEEPIEDLINQEDVQLFINSIKLVDYVEEVIENNEELVEENVEENTEKVEESQDIQEEPMG